MDISKFSNVSYYNSCERKKIKQISIREWISLIPELTWILTEYEEVVVTVGTDSTIVFETELKFESLVVKIVE